MDLSSPQLVYADNLFKLKLLQADGQNYEDLFVEVMTLRYPDFRPVKPQGRLGDRKNDGYVAQDGSFHQVYAPQRLDEREAAAVAKLEKDFSGLLEYWNSVCPIRRFRYVLNDKFKGAFPEVETALLRIKEAHGLEECSPFLNKDLMREFASLDSRGVMKLVGHLPSSEEIGDLDFTVFSEVLEHIINTNHRISSKGELVVPDFDEKLQFNRLSPVVGNLLKTGSLQSGVVESFFNSSYGFSKTAVRDRLAELYSERKSDLVLDKENEHPGDLIFFGLLESIVPSQMFAARNAAIVLLGYFFETCDVYDNPKRLI